MIAAKFTATQGRTCWLKESVELTEEVAWGDFKNYPGRINAASFLISFKLFGGVYHAAVTEGKTSLTRWINIFNTTVLNQYMCL